MNRVAVVGATGFVGSAVVSALGELGVEVLQVRAPRLAPVDSSVLVGAPSKFPFSHSEVSKLRSAFAGCTAVVCCAGDPDASNTDESALNAANAAVPAIVARACAQADVARFVHVSSAVVQGRLPELDDSERVDLFSAYSRSKAAGERLARLYGPPETTCYRPPSVHARSRRVTRGIARIARTPLATVAGKGQQSSPQTLVGNAGSAIAFLATTPASPPPIVHHPSEGITTGSLMRLLGGREPTHLPPFFASSITRTLNLIGHRFPPIAANARRIEMMWFGQRQADSWLTHQGWVPPLAEDAWIELGEAVRNELPGGSR